MVQTDTSTSTNVSLVETYISACLFSINRSGKCSKYFKFKNNFVKLFQLQANSINWEISQFRRPLSQCFAHSEQIFDRCRWLMSFFILINWFIARCRSSVWLGPNMFYESEMMANIGTNTSSGTLLSVKSLCFMKINCSLWVMRHLEGNEPEKRGLKFLITQRMFWGKFEGFFWSFLKAFIGKLKSKF